ncbi:MAG: 5'-3' exonuclease H3TH domain-containing protein, partial [Candidatus Omnitrophota bacterium]
MRKPKLLIIDAPGLCYRAYYAIKNLSTSYGQATNAIYGFVTMLEKLMHTQKPDYVAVCFDLGKVTFRQKKFADYKIQRPPMPDELISQIPLIKEIINAYNLSIFEKEGFEADDLIATLAEKFASKDLEIVVVTSDKDMLQIVSKNIFIFNPYKEEGVLYDEKKVIDFFGVKPKNIIDFLSLTGDNADNIPGIPGIGEKTAQSILTKTKDLDSLIKNIDHLDLSEKIKESLKRNIDMLNLNKELVKLDTNVDIDCNLEGLKVTQANTQELYSLFKKLEFKKLI